MRGAAAVVVIVTGVGAIVADVIGGGGRGVGDVVSISQHSPRAVLLRRLWPYIAKVWGRVV